MHRYCTFFDHRYLTRGVSMIRSLRHADPGCEITAVCLTPECSVALSQLGEQGVRLISLEELERDNPDLLAIKNSRSLLEYYFTLTACAIAGVMQGAAPEDFVTYVDADLMFYSSVAPLYEEMAGASIGLIAHRYPWWKRNGLKFGYFNSGWACFRCDPTGRSAVLWWRQRCIEWCGDRTADGRFADQRYLDEVFRRFPFAVEITHPGANLAPWNLGRHAITWTASGGPLVNRKWPLIFFHFQGAEEIAPGLFLANHLPHLAPFPGVVRDAVYAPYIALLGRISSELGAVQPAGPPSPTHARPLSWRQSGWSATWLRLAARWLNHYASSIVLFIGPLPEPIMGQAYACQVFLDALQKTHAVSVIDLNKPSLTQASIYHRIWEIAQVLLAARKASQLAAAIYMNLSQSYAGNLRDLMIYFVCFKKLPNTAVHLHGGDGMRQILGRNHRLLRFINRSFLRHIGAVIVLSRRFANIFEGVAPLDHIKIVPNFAPESLYASEETIEEKFPRDQAFSQANPLRLLFLSNMLPGKGYEELVEAYETLAPADRAMVRLDIAGGFEDDEGRAAFLGSIEGLQNVRYHGIVRGKAKEALFRQAQVFCLPTYYRYEGQPISILEAYASGCVVMTTDHSGIFDIFRPGRNGYCVDKSSVSSIRRVIQRIIEDPSALRPMALNNRKDAELYPTSKYNDRLVHIVESLMPQVPPL